MDWLITNRQAGRRVIDRLAVVAFVVVVMFSGSSRAASDVGFGTSWPIDDANPAAGVPSQEEANKRALEFGYYLMELARIATESEAAGDLARARRYYEAISIAAPKRSLGPRKACELDIKLGHFSEAATSCHETLFREDVVVGDYLRYIDVLTRQTEPLSEEQVEFAKSAIEQLEKDQPVSAQEARCMLGAEISDQALLDECVPVLLEERGNEDVKTLAFAWQRAMLSDDLAEAEQRIAEIQSTGAPEQVTAKMIRLLGEKRRELEIQAEQKRGRRIRWTVAFFAISLIIWVLIRRRRRH